MVQLWQNAGWADKRIAQNSKQSSNEFSINRISKKCRLQYILKKLVMH